MWSMGCITSATDPLLYYRDGKGPGRKEQQTPTKVYFSLGEANSLMTELETEFLWSNTQTLSTVISNNLPMEEDRFNKIGDEHIIFRCNYRKLCRK
jgi:hypothetical protein